MISKIELYFSDLNEEAQKELLKTANISDPKEANWDVFPITILEFEIEGES